MDDSKSTCHGRTGLPVDLPSEKRVETSCSLVAGLPPGYGRLQRSVGGEHGGLQGQVGHRTGFILPLDPALNGNPLIGVAICGEQTRFVDTAIIKECAAEK